jgi:hypothetical protein
MPGDGLKKLMELSAGQNRNGEGSGGFKREKKGRTKNGKKTSYPFFLSFFINPVKIRDVFFQFIQQFSGAIPAFLGKNQDHDP